jgi:hypothetical protein
MYMHTHKNANLCMRNRSMQLSFNCIMHITVLNQQSLSKPRSTIAGGNTVNATHAVYACSYPLYVHQCMLNEPLTRCHCRPTRLMFTSLLDAASAAGQYELCEALLIRIQPETGSRPFKMHYRCVMEVR